MLPRCLNMLPSQHDKRPQSALKYAGVLAPEQRADLLERRSYECYVTGQISDACEARRQALEIWQQVGNKIRQGDNLRWLSRFAWYLGRNEEAEACARKAITLLEALMRATCSPQTSHMRLMAL